LTKSVAVVYNIVHTVFFILKMAMTETVACRQVFAASRGRWEPGRTDGAKIPPEPRTEGSRLRRVTGVRRFEWQKQVGWYRG
jgi:hypothetical protein